MKNLITALLLVSSFSASALDERCSPYVTETTTLIARSNSCDDAAKLARSCITGSRRDSELAYAAIEVCRDLIGGEEHLPVAKKNKLGRGYKSCNETHGNNHSAALFCMMDVLRLL